MRLERLYNPENGPMRVGIALSGKGTNAVKILDLQEMLIDYMGRCPYEVVALFTENPGSNAGAIGERFHLPVVPNDLKSFYRERGKPLNDEPTRVEFDKKTIELLAPHKIDTLAYAGYMRKASPLLVRAFLGVNVHPADLDILNEIGKRKYTGGHAVRDAILAGEKYLRATTHIVEDVVDGGRLLMRSKPLEVQLGENFDPKNVEIVERVVDENQDRLKEVGDWVIFPKTLIYLAQGRYEKDWVGNLHFDGKPIPGGLLVD